MKLILCFTVAFVLTLCGASGEQQRILRRVIKSTPTATNLARVRLVTVRAPSAERGAVAEISSKEAANFGQRSSNETTSTANSQQQPVAGNNKSKSSSSSPSTPAPAPTQATPTTTTPTTNNPAPAITTTSKPKASDRQQQSGQSAAAAAEVELLSSAPSFWQAMTAVEAPAAMLIATGTRAAQASSSSSVASGDLSQSSSTLHSSEESVSSSSSDFLRSSSSSSSGVKGGYAKQSVGETFSRLRQQQAGGVKQGQQYFYPAQQVKAPPSKTSPYQATKTSWYQPPATTTTPRPAPIVQEQQYEQQQSEQYVEQQLYEAAPLGMAEPFAFDFKTEDNSGNGQYRKEESDKNGVVRGSYGYTDASGIYRHVEYVADHNGFRANIKSNEPGLIGETQPASIQMASGAGSQRLSAASSFESNVNSGDNGEWIAASASNSQGSSSADLAVAPPDFESSHRPESLRSPRHFRN